MTTSNMNFGPEWMRKLASTDKAASSDSIEQDSTLQEPSQLPTSTTSYSSITGKLREDGSRSEDNDTIDSLNPFKYSKEYMLSFFKEIAAPLDFEKHEIASVEECLQPISFSPLSELEQKLISSGQVNSSSNRRIVQNQHTQNQQHRNLERNNREGNTNRGGRGGARTNYNRNNGGGGGWGNVSKSSIGTFGSDGVFRMEGAGDSLEGSDFAMTAEMFEAERRAYHRNNQNRGGSGHQDDSLDGFETVGGRGGRGSLKNILVGLPGADEQEEFNMFNPEDVSNWYYNDPTGVTQGPFTGFEMHEWYIAGYFQGDLLVRRETDSSFEPLAHLINRIGDDEKPFLTPPRSSHLKTILTPRSARFNFSNFDSEPDNTFGDFSKSQAYGNFLTSNPLSNNIYNQQSDLHQQSYLNQFSPSMVRNPYDEAAYYKAQQVQQERQLFLQQQMAHPFSSNPYNSMHSGIVANDNQHLYNTHSQSIHQGNVWNNNPSASNQQAYSNPIEKHSQSPTEKEENVSKIAEDKVVAGLNKLNINEEKSKVSPEEGKASTPTNETKVKGNNKAKGSPHNNKQELKEENGNKKVAEKPVKSGLPSTPAPWQGSSKPTKSLREIQLEEEAQMKSRAANQSSEPKRYADTLAKKTTPGWNSVAQQSSTVVKSSSSQSNKNKGGSSQPSEKFINWIRSMFRTFVEINADELINMLLSFPMDPSPQFKEIVKDMFLEQQSKGNHNIVDHRKFAEEFIIRRKIDAGILNSSALPNNPLKVPTLSKSETNESFQLVGKKNRKRV